MTILPLHILHVAVGAVDSSQGITLVYRLLILLILLVPSTGRALDGIRTIASTVEIKKSGEVLIIEDSYVKYEKAPYLSDGFYRSFFEMPIDSSAPPPFEFAGGTLVTTGEPLLGTHERYGNNWLIWLRPKDGVIPSGELHYESNYRVRNGIVLEGGGERFIWPISGLFYLNEIAKIEATILPPKSLSPQDVNAQAFHRVLNDETKEYEGRYKSSAVVSKTSDPNGQGTMISVSTQESLPGGTALFVEVVWPKGVIHRRTLRNDPSPVSRGAQSEDFGL